MLLTLGIPISVTYLINIFEDNCWEFQKLPRLEELELISQISLYITRCFMLSQSSDVNCEGGFGRLFVYIPITNVEYSGTHQQIK